MPPTSLTKHYGVEDLSARVGFIQLFSQADFFGELDLAKDRLGGGRLGTRTSANLQPMENQELTRHSQGH